MTFSTTMINLSNYHFVPGALVPSLVESTKVTEGVYLILIRQGVGLLRSAGYTDKAPPILPGDLAHLYTGHSGEIGLRLERHFRGDAFVSTFRQSLLCLEKAVGALSQTGGAFSADLEADLTAWLAENAAVAWRPCAAAHRAETRLLARLPSPLNIQGRRSHPFARRLMGMRREFYGWYRLPKPREADNFSTKTLLTASGASDPSPQVLTMGPDRECL